MITNHSFHAKLLLSPIFFKLNSACNCWKPCSGHKSCKCEKLLPKWHLLSELLQRYFSKL